MTEPGEMDELRARLRRAEEDAAAARILAGGADRDVGEIGSELRGFRAESRAEFTDVRTEMRGFRDQNNRVLNAMRADLTDLRAQMNRGFSRVDEQFAQVDRNFLAVRGQLDAVAAFMQMIATKLPGGNGDPPEG